jgi:peptide/nickel transport system substrate-binding protein
VSHRRSSVSKGIAAAIALLLFAAGCGGGDAGSGGSGEDAGDPVRGGSVTYGLEAETTGGWCLPESQLAISGILVARTIYDTLTAPNAKGEYVPYLAKSVEPNEEFTEWTITLREGVKFHDGTPLDAEVVKNNLDAYRGKYEGRAPLLFLFVFQNLTDVAVVDDMTVKVTTEVPWVAFPAYLFASGRLGMVAQSQLDDQETCDRKLVGTGPFKFKSWKVNQEFVAEKNPDYWQEAPDGKPYPYLDEIRFQPTPEPQQRVNALQAGQLQAMHGSGADEFVDLRALEEAGTIGLYESEKFAEVSYVMVNASKPPVDDVRVRRALAMAIDREEYKEIINQGLFTMASGPYAPGSIGYLKDSGYPTYDPDGAEKLVKEYEDEKGPITISYRSTPSPATQRVAQFLQEKLKEVGIEFKLQTVEQSELINTAISGDFQLIGWRNHPGGDPDEQYVWWYKGSPANFGKFQDDTMQGLLDEGRSEPDPDKRKEIYEDVNRRFADQVWNLWANWTRWAIGTDAGVHGIDLETAPKLPDGSDPFPGLATGHPLHGIWINE